jgi:signal transduction histidine kinase
LSQASVLIVSDDTEFARTAAARWQAEAHAPEVTLATSDLWHASSATGYDLVIVGPVRHGKSTSILSSLDPGISTAVVCVPENENEFGGLRKLHSQALLIPKRDGWMEVLIVLSSEALRRVNALNRAQRAERVALEAQRHAILGRYMLEMRPGINNALTSAIGNADLLLLEPGQLSPECRDQIRTIHAMALRLNEVMQRFSSLAAEMRAGETESQAETGLVSHGYIVRQ